MPKRKWAYVELQFASSADQWTVYAKFRADGDAFRYANMVANNDSVAAIVIGIRLIDKSGWISYVRNSERIG